MDSDVQTTLTPDVGRDLRSDHSQQKEAARKFWSRYDTDNEGKVSIEKLAQHLQDAGVIGEDDEHIKKLIEVWDTTNTGYITFREFYRVFAYYNHYRGGYMKGYEVGYARAHLPSLQDTLLTPRAELTFNAFVGMVLGSDVLFDNLAGFHSNFTPTQLRHGHLTLDSHVELSAMEDFLAGTWSGIVTTLVGHPFDTVKLRMQTGNVVRSSDVASFKTMRDLSNEVQETATQVLRRTIKDEGMLAVYKGMLAPLASVALVNSIVFMTYEQTKHFIRWWNDDPLPLPGQHPPPLSNNYLAAAGGVGGLVACLVVCPIELVRSRLQVQSSIAPMYKGPTDCARQVYSKHGIRGLYAGMCSTILRDVPAYMAQFYIYESLKKVFTPKGKRVSDLKAPSLMMAGGIAGCFGWLCTYPIDIIKSRLQVERPGRYKSHPWLPDGGMVDCGRTIIRESGCKGLFRGLSPALLRAFPVGAGGFTAYESASRFFKRRRRANTRKENEER